ncbi:hypothetical protein V8E52_009425 [Russula decolorans]
MDSKLKSLKVADLKEICSRANIPTTTRSTKADLITKILASQPAIDAYSAKYQQNESAAPPSKPAPPKEVDWTLVEPSRVVPVPVAASNSSPTKTAPAPAKPQSKVQKAANSGSEAPKTLVSVPATSADEEFEKRKARAARFGIALVEPPKHKTKPTPGIAPKAVKATDDTEKLKARAARFGIAKLEQSGDATVVAVNSKKRATPVGEEVDMDEQERRRKRAERFGNPVLGAKA